MTTTTFKKIASAVAAVALFFVSQNTFAQGSDDSQATRLGIGISAGASTTNPYGFVIGGDVRLQKDLASNVSGMVSLGYNNFSVKDSAPIPNYGVIPLKVGLKVFPVERFYFSGELGAEFSTQKGARTAFVYAPGIGVGTNSGIDIGMRYEAIQRTGSTLGQVALRLAYGFNLSK
jgi:hypothetical protein